MAKAKKAGKNSIDIETVKEVANGRWKDILHSVGDIPLEYLTGQHIKCPKCDGKDRFRFADWDGDGGVICNQCFPNENGDGLAAIGWIRDIGFHEVVSEVAHYLGLNGDGEYKKKPPPDAKLEWLDWDDYSAWLWCRTKPGVSIDGIKATGAKLAKYNHQQYVLAFPVWGQHLGDAPPVGWVIVDRSGRPLPVFNENGVIVDLLSKPKTMPGTLPGVIGDVARLKEATAVWKLEGVSDVLTWLSMADIPSSHAAITNVHGCQERPKKWILELFRDKTAYVLHDADKPGQEGATGRKKNRVHQPGWADEIATAALKCTNVKLPYPIEDSHGKDFRDWVNEGGTFESLVELAGNSDTIQSYTQMANEAIDDPHRLARLNLDNYETRNDGRTIRYWKDSWMLWKRHRYINTSEKEIGAKVTASVKEEFDRENKERLESYRKRKEAGKLEEEEDKGPPTVRKVTPGLVGSVLNATRSLVCISGEIELDTWLPDRKRRNYIAMENGIFDVNAFLADADEVMLPHTPEWFSTVVLPYKFDPTAECPKWEGFLEHNLEMDPERIKVLQEWAGYCLMPDTSMQKFLIMEGEGANGKSVFCAGMEAIVGMANCSHVQLEMFGDRFSKTETLGKLINICGDAGEIDKVAEGTIKAFTSGNRMTFDRKGLSGIHCEPTARLMIACNNRPRFSDRTGGIWRRVVIIPWRLEIPPGERVLNMDKPWWWIESGELPGMFCWAIAGLQRLRSQSAFTVCQAMNESLEDYQMDSNPSKQFLTEHFQMEASQPPVSAPWMYKKYREWAASSGHYPLSDRQFGKEVHRVFKGIKRVKKGNRSNRVNCYEGLTYQDGVFSNEDLSGATPDTF